MEDEWFITSGHPMEKGHCLSFLALVTGERATVMKCWPEWDLQQRIPRRGHGMLYWHCTQFQKSVFSFRPMEAARNTGSFPSRRWLV